MNVAKAPLKKLLGMAVRSEIDSNRIYTELAKRVKNPLLQEKFSILAFEEKKHKEVLENLFDVLYQGEKMEIPEKTEEALLPSIHFSPSSTLAQILYQAMQSEKAAQNFYASLAKRVKAQKKKILEYLSKVEKSHYMMLRSEYVLALQFEDYAEKDIDKVVT